MPKRILVLDDLKAKFSQFNEIADVTARLQETLRLIGTENKAYAGQDDAIAEAYHKEIDQPTTDLVTLVTSIERLFTLTGENGRAVADDFQRASVDAEGAARAW